MSDNALNISLRPSNWQEVIGHEKLVAAIQNLIKERVPRAFLFSGSFGAGKTTLAKIVARAIQGPDFPDYLEPELIEQNAADDAKIDDIRPLIEQSAYMPMVGKYRVIILDEAHKLTEAAQNSLLIPFESPTNPTVWIFCTTNHAKILKGLRDRAAHFEIPLMSKAERRELIKRAAYYHTKGAMTEAQFSVFADAIDEHEIASPREILTAFERFAAGLPAEQAILIANASPDLFEVVKQVCFGNWTNARPLIEKIGADEQRSKLDTVQRMRPMLAGFLKSYLVPKAGKTPDPGRAKAAAEAMRVLIDYSPQPSDNEIAWSCFIAAMYLVAGKMASIGR